MIQLMLVRMTFGDCPASGILSECTDIIGEDPDLSPSTKDFIQSSFDVDDGGSSSQFPQRLEKICAELQPVMNKYGFQLKHILKNYQKSEGLTTSESEESILGLCWNFQKDTLIPLLEVFLTKKRRGVHTSSPMCEASIQNAVITTRVILRVTGSLYDLSGIPERIADAVHDLNALRLEQLNDAAVAFLPNGL